MASVKAIFVMTIILFLAISPISLCNLIDRIPYSVRCNIIPEPERYNLQPRNNSDIDLRPIKFSPGYKCRQVPFVPIEPGRRRLWYVPPNIEQKVPSLLYQVSGFSILYIIFIFLQEDFSNQLCNFRNFIVKIFFPWRDFFRNNILKIWYGIICDLVKIKKSIIFQSNIIFCLRISL